MGWRQQCNIPCMRGVLRMCEQGIRGNQNTVQEACVCEPNYVGHMCRDLGGWACFGKLHLFVI